MIIFALSGAGITKEVNLVAVLGLGSVGVLLASGIVKAADPKAALEDLVSKALIPHFCILLVISVFVIYNNLTQFLD